MPLALRTKEVQINRNEQALILVASDNLDVTSQKGVSPANLDVG